MKILVYKRTHDNDPDNKGQFGVNDCMGRIRNYDYDAVIGIGAKYTDPGSEGLSLKINWIGVKPLRTNSFNNGNPIVCFERFKHFHDKGDYIPNKYPHLYEYMYQVGVGKRYKILNSDIKKEVYDEAISIINSINNYESLNSCDVDKIVDES